MTAGLLSEPSSAGYPADRIFVPRGNPDPQASKYGAKCGPAWGERV